MAAGLEKGRYQARFADSAADLAAAQRLRHLCFIDTPGRPPRPDRLDRDRFDPLCRHLLVEETATGTLAACCRILPLRNGADIGTSYSAQHYALDALATYPAPMAEIGRFCIAPRHSGADADVLRLAWAALTRFVDESGVRMLFGCSSFPGTEAGVYRDAFSLLQERHLAPGHWRPGIKAPDIVRFGQTRTPADPRRALLRMPPLLRSYLLMGGWVSDHAVIDTELDTLHVFTGVEIGKVPGARSARLRAVAS